jgi:opacity protein-like surface antigen
MLYSPEFEVSLTKGQEYAGREFGGGEKYSIGLTFYEYILTIPNANVGFGFSRLVGTRKYSYIKDRLEITSLNIYYWFPILDYLTAYVGTGISNYDSDIEVKIEINNDKLYDFNYDTGYNFGGGIQYQYSHIAFGVFAKYFAFNSAEQEFTTSNNCSSGCRYKYNYDPSGFNLGIYAGARF